MTATRICWGFGIFVFCSALQVAVAASEASFRVDDYLVVPSGLKNALGRRWIRFETGSSAANIVSGRTRIIFRLPDADVASPETRRLVANWVVKSWLLNRLAGQAKGNVLLELPRDPNSTRPLKDRIERVATLALAGQGRELVEDEAAQLWWALSFEAQPMPPGPLRKGETLLLGLHLRGYPGLGGRDFGALDLGHSALGLRVFGDEGEDDFVLNPGAKDAVTGVEVALPFFPKAEVLSMVRVANLWDWAESMLVESRMRLKVHVYRINPLQARALRFIARHGDRWVSARARLLGENCADGAHDLLSAILSRDRPLFPKPVGTILPAALFSRMKARFSFLGSSEFKLREGGSRPGANYLEFSSPIKAHTEAFKAYRAFEESLR